jgi:hypothetical protein
LLFLLPQGEGIDSRANQNSNDDILRR